MSNATKLSLSPDDYVFGGHAGHELVTITNMTLQTDAIYEDGVLRPLTPLGLEEHQVVSIVVCTMPQPGDSTQRPIRNHSAFLSSYAPEDEGLYDDYPAG
jgi:predicted DNA-binding antitoxin AbrB/MazE fold protein